MSKLLWVTYASLAANILLVGFLLGSATARPPFPPHDMRPGFGGPGGPGGPGGGGMLSGAMDKMSEPGRKLVQEAITDIRNYHETARPQIEATRRKITDIIGSAELDAKELTAAELDMRNIMQDTMGKIRGRVRDLLEKLSPDERKILADHMRNAPPPPPPMI